jgi:uncharacterized surface protein with fasciclin (FAS1) repeats
MKKLLGVGLTAALLSTVVAQTTPGTIVDVASANSTFTTLVTAVKAGDLVETLSGKGPFTVFAPTNDAFAKLPAGTVENLVKPENKKTLVGILTYHVVPSSVLAADVVKLSGKTVKTVQGGELTVNVKDGKVSLTDAMKGTANVTATDVKASNGVIHVIDAVLMPPAEK